MGEESEDHDEPAADDGDDPGEPPSDGAEDPARGDDDSPAEETESEDSPAEETESEDSPAEGDPLPDDEVMAGGPAYEGATEDMAEEESADDEETAGDSADTETPDEPTDEPDSLATPPDEDHADDQEEEELGQPYGTGPPGTPEPPSDPDSVGPDQSEPTHTHHDVAEGDADEEEGVEPYTTADKVYEGPKPAETYLDDAGGGGPSADSEMPLTEHIREMLIRLTIVVAVAGVVSVATYPFTEDIINFIWNSILPVGEQTRPRLYGVLEFLFTKLKVASLAGLIIALPVVVYQTYQFMKPGLYPHERRYYLAAVPTSLVLALVGVSFAYFVILPAIFTYFLHYTEGVARIGFALGRTFDLILVLMGYLAVVFQIPLFIMLAMMMNVVTRQWLADRRLLFWGGFLGISFILFAPADPTGASPFLVTITMILLFEGTLFLTKWTQRARDAAS